MQESAPQDPGYQLVVEHYNAGRYGDMCNAAKELLRRIPDHPKGWHMLGLGSLLCGENDEALAALRRASELQPENSEVWDHLGAACNFLGRLEDALIASERGLSLTPTRAESWINHGKNLKDLGRDSEAIAAYETAIKINPGLIEAHNNLGVALLDGRRFEHAAEAFRAAIRANPDHPWGHNNLGIALRELGQPEAARAACLRALEIDPDFAKAWNNLGNIEHQRGQEEAAIGAYQKALALVPDDPEVQNNLGSSLAVLHRSDEAVAAFRSALAGQPNNPTIWNNLGNALPDVADKVEAFRRALQITPDFPQARSNLLFSLHYLPRIAEAEILNEARAYGRLVERNASPFSAWENDRSLDRPLRIGIVSADLCQHPVAYFLESVLAALDKTRFTLFAYYNERKEDAWTQRFRTLLPQWRNVFGLPDTEVIKQIRTDRIDILIDLSGHTAGNRLPVFAAHPAPVQISWLGYFGTTGLTAMDYLLADHVGVPVGEEDRFTETIWRLPETRLCFTPPNEIEIKSYPLRNDPRVTFGCFNNHNKIHAEVITTWSRLLAATPHSGLLIKNSRCKDVAYHRHLRQCFAEHGIAADRIAFAPPSDRDSYLAAYNDVDITLDPYPYTGGTTTAESLWMGVPVLTLAGDSLIARQGAGLLLAAGLPDWIAKSEDEYVEKGRHYANQRSALNQLRTGLRAQLKTSALMDATRFAQQLGDAWRGMWIQHIARQR